MKRIFLLFGLLICTVTLFMAADSGYYQLFNARPTWAQHESTQFETNSSNISIASQAVVTNLHAADGDASNPAYAFGSDNNTGMFNHDLNNALRFSVLGNVMESLQSGTVTFGTNSLTGMYLQGYTNLQTELGFRVGAGNALKDRWFITRVTGESGSDTGSDLEIRAIHDNGNQIDAPIKITRAAGGSIIFNRPVVLTNVNASLLLTVANPTNVVDLAIGSQTNILNDDITIAHATNGVAGFEYTHVRWFWPGGATRVLTIPSGWVTNVNSPVPANITNNTITRMIVTSLGDTSSAANQTNVFVSFEYYVP